MGDVGGELDKLSQYRRRKPADSVRQHVTRLAPGALYCISPHATRSPARTIALLLFLLYNITVRNKPPNIASRARESVGARIRRRRKEIGLTQVELARAAGVNQGYISEIERNRVTPRQRTIDALAVALNMPQGVLIGGGHDHDNPQPLETRELPLLGSIPAGPPASSQEQLEMFPVLRHQWSPDYFCLRLSYDSMEPTLKPGDIVLVHYRPGVDAEHVQGRVCACLVDGEPTLKRVSVEWRKGDRFVVLRGDNPRLPPLLLDSSHDFSIQGTVIRLVCREL